ncbi:DNA/RNA non-specific endonuclease protein (plasmid) [Rhizobium etli bv. mimosae str. IE4771]|uniref:Serine protease n=1 Tax=Rhizobium etli bv. mimosae str. IE4771 TaxID=1432050 RepID=A0A060I2U8_RHIET|nr:DNA/RNA non-specific endonuclease [Rhizobium sp. IE4771]AIC29508.1 DNA/RNA non-specific endonuclease protein [Rhizobium sp. IE4771]
MSRLEKMRLVRREVQAEAAERFQARTSEREISKSLIAENGPGSADSEIRQQIYRQRIANIKMLREISPRIPLPLGIERKIGQWDPILVAPNEIARKAGRPVARIVELGGQGIVPEGFATGFLVAPDLILTNWHVFQSRSEAKGCAANFLYEKTPQGTQVGVSFELEPDRFYLADEKLDFAFVGVKSTAASPEDLGQITLIEATPKILKGEAVNIIQYPEGGPKQYAVAQNRLVDVLDDGYLHYETDTLEGSSGSPAFSVNWELVAVHHASIPLMRNGRVVATDGSEWTEEMGDDRVKWIANEGIRVSSLVRRLRALTGSNPSEEQILRSLIASTGDPVAEALGVIGQTSVATSQRAVPIIVGESASMSGVNFTFTGPVTINVTSSAPVVAPDVETARAAGDIAPEKAIRFDPDYDNRGGYDPSFLHDDGGINVPIPIMPDELQADLLLGDDRKPLILKYHHFELVMNRKRRLQAWSAVNIDYLSSRKKAGERTMWGSDKWVPDPRIPARVQIFDADFYKPAGNIDRGHIVRREDNEWGDSDLEMEYANSDTFHWTNCTPQHEAFNQSSPKGRIYSGMEGIWGAFENHIQQSRKGGDTKACILAGPILADKDPSEDFGLGEIQYPLRFWKIVCMAEGPEQKDLKAFGFILTQSDVVKRFGIETFRPGRFKRYQVSLDTIAADSGLKFDQLLLDADTMRGQGDLELTNVQDVRGL